jgi:hypothetical protein
MKTILAFLLATGLFATFTHADVVIYRGVDKVSADVVNAAGYGKSINMYLIVDYDNARYNLLFFGLHFIGGKHYFKQITSANFALAPLPKGQTASLIVSSSTSNSSSTLFYNHLEFFRGTNKTLLVQRNPSPVLLNRPNRLKGTSISASSDPTSKVFIEQHYGLTFQGSATIKANSANQTIDQVLDGLVAGLTAKGYTSP